MGGSHRSLRQADHEQIPSFRGACHTPSPELRPGGVPASTSGDVVEPTYEQAAMSSSTKDSQRVSLFKQRDVSLLRKISRTRSCYNKFWLLMKRVASV